VRPNTAVWSIAGVCGLLALLGTCMLLLLFVLLRYGTQQVLPLPAPSASLDYAPSPLAVDAIPSLYLHLYEEAASRYGLDWTVLAGIGTVECDNGQDPAPSCTVPGALNYAGAGGPAQFLVSTWRKYGVTPDGRGSPNMWDPADAIYSMANYLRSSGAPGNYRQAIYAYNHAWWYVAEVLAWAARYRAAHGPALPTLLSTARSGSTPAPTVTRHLARHLAR
jgi:soluble lytic murein transglycosylase-like protein